jgi:hypothetical protein
MQQIMLADCFKMIKGAPQKFFALLESFLRKTQPGMTNCYTANSCAKKN